MRWVPASAAAAEDASGNKAESSETKVVPPTTNRKAARVFAHERVPFCVFGKRLLMDCGNAPFFRLARREMGNDYAQRLMAGSGAFASTRKSASLVAVAAPISATTMPAA